MSQRERITLFAGDFEDQPSTDFRWVAAWLERWKSELRIASCSTGGWEHVWNVEAPRQAVAEVPAHLFCASEWSAWTVPHKSTRDEIATVVFAALRRTMPEREKFELQERFIKDLRLISDDATQIILDVERVLRVRVERKKWRQVETIGEMIDLLASELKAS